MNVGYVLTQPWFKHYRKEIKLSNADALRWIDNIRVGKWNMAFENGQ